MNDRYNDECWVNKTIFTAIDKCMDILLYRLPEEIILLCNIQPIADEIREERNPSIVVQSELPPPAFDTEEELDEAMSD